MLEWSRSELRTLAIWHWAHAWQLDEGDWTITVTTDGVTCDRPSLGDPESEMLGREMMIRTWAMRDPEHWRGTIVVKRKSDTYHPPE